MAVSSLDLGSAPEIEDIPQTPSSRRPRWYIEALAILWLCWVYDLITNLAPLRQSVALSHGWSILHLEEVLHLDPEVSMDRWLSDHHALAAWVSNYYDNAHFAVTLGVLGWLWWYHAEHYRPLRTSLVLVNAIGFVVFWVYPVAPPRMLPGSHIADVVARSGAFGSWHSGALAHYADELAAMPSLHLAWATWSALAVWSVLRHHHRWAVAVWAYPISTTLAVLSTGNHYLADVAAGVATLVAAAMMTGPVTRVAQRAAGLIAGAGANRPAVSGPPRRQR